MEYDPTPINKYLSPIFSNTTFSFGPKIILATVWNPLDEVKFTLCIRFTIQDKKIIMNNTNKSPEMILISSPWLIMPGLKVDDQPTELVRERLKNARWGTLLFI
ncbi:hypothetical protein LEG80045_16570 [Legionella pneumophila]|nr:hypothetical protein LEG80045_16570 [Legionella pneumophila]